MKKQSTGSMAVELRRILEEMTSAQGRLHEAVRSKLESMRRADMNGMIEAGRSEGEIVAEIGVLDERRKSVASRLCECVGLPVSTGGKGVSLRILAERLEPSGRAALSQAAQRLREAMLKVAEANRVVEMVSREMLEHFKAVFSAMVQEEGEDRVYSPRGAKGTGGGSRVLDAIG